MNTDTQARRRSMDRFHQFRLQGLAVALSLVSCTHLERIPDEPKPAGPPLLRIDVEDADEARLVEQELKLRPVRARGRTLYFERTDDSERRLRGAGFEPVAADPEEGAAEVVVVRRTGPETRLTDAGARVLLREKAYWIVRVTPAQRRTLARLDFGIEPLGDREPHPRQVSVTAADATQVREVVALHMDVFHVEGPRKGEKGLVVRGAAFDDGIDALRAERLNVVVLPDLPGVTR
jgi:hypothetical protein